MFLPRLRRAAVDHHGHLQAPHPLRRRARRLLDAQVGEKPAHKQLLHPSVLEDGLQLGPLEGAEIVAPGQHDLRVIERSQPVDEVAVPRALREQAVQLAVILRIEIGLLEGLAGFHNHGRMNDERISFARCAQKPFHLLDHAHIFHQGRYAVIEFAALADELVLHIQENERISAPFRSSASSAGVSLLGTSFLGHLMFSVVSARRCSQALSSTG
mmetsp:Transcript_49912/g.150108  ORF Transcript_49912/g.150108 Transcript_49912/m.150108 type:complete len:214 (+) Transcript_49912:469-1110(+)